MTFDAHDAPAMLAPDVDRGPTDRWIVFRPSSLPPVTAASTTVATA